MKLNKFPAFHRKKNVRQKIILFWVAAIRSILDTNRKLKKIPEPPSLIRHLIFWSIQQQLEDGDILCSKLRLMEPCDHTPSLARAVRSTFAVGGAGAAITTGARP